VALSHQLENAGLFNQGQDYTGGDTLFWLLMNSQWADSSDWIDPTTNSATHFLFPGNPNLPLGWHEENSSNSPGDRRGLITISEPTFPAGGSICSDYAFIYDRSGSTRMENVQNLLNIAASVKTFHDDFQSFPCFSPNYNSTELLTPTELTIYPNPSNGLFQLSHEVEKLDVFDFQGRLIRQFAAVQEVDLRHLATGTYQLVCKVNKRTQLLRIVKL
jgi:hypothetical protein